MFIWIDMLNRMKIQYLLGLHLKVFQELLFLIILKELMIIIYL